MATNAVREIEFQQFLDSTNHACQRKRSFSKDKGIDRRNQTGKGDFAKIKICEEKLTQNRR